MKKLVSLFVSALLLVGCTSTKVASTPSPTPTSVPVEVKDLNILSPTGAPGYSLIPVAKDNTITLQEGADALQAAFVSPDASYDAIIAPTNLGVKLSQAGKSNYVLAGIITTGNLYIVASDANVLESNETIAAFGEKAVPGLVYSSLFADSPMQTVWYSAVSEAQAALLSNQAKAALLAEPAATATILKAKQNGMTLQKVADLQEKWGSDGYPMAALFVRKSDAQDKKAVYAKLLETLATYSEKAAQSEDVVVQDLESLEKEGVTLYTNSVGYPVVAKAYTGMGIHPSTIKDTDNLNAFLKLFGMEISDSDYLSLK